MKKKISLSILGLLLFTAIYAQNDSLQVFLSGNVENFFLEHSSTAYHQQNLSDFMSRKQYLEYRLNHTPYLKNISLFQDIFNYLPVNFVDKYYMNDIHLMSVFNFVDFKVNLQNPDYLIFSIPINSWDVTWKNFWKPNTYFKSWFSHPKGTKNVTEEERF